MLRVVLPALLFKRNDANRCVTSLTLARLLCHPQQSLRLFVLVCLFILSVLPAHAEEEALLPTHSIADHVVISEVKTNNSDKNEFVELYNPTAQPIEMVNWKLRRRTSGITESNLASSFSGTIPAFGYFLITPNGT